MAPRTTATPNVDCKSCPLRRLPAFRAFTDDELDFMVQFKRGEMKIAAGADILTANASSTHMFTLYSGWAFRYLLLPDGTRQIFNFLLPGDFIGLQSSVFDAMEHSVAALTEVSLCVFQRSELWTLYRQFPSLGFDVTWLTAHEEHLVDDNLATVGQRDARSRIAYLMLQLYRRQEHLELAKKYVCPWPLTQQHIADATGLSLVHTNRTMRWLMRQGLIEIDGERLSLHKPEQLMRMAMVDEDRLRLRPIL